MPEPDPQPRFSPRLVSSIEAAVAARRRQQHAAMRPLPGPADQLIGTMQTVKTARFSAAERLEHKHIVSVFALATVSLYFVGLSVWQTVYSASLEPATHQLITLVSIMSSIATLVLALIDSMNDYKIKAHHMHACALAVNDLLQELKLLQTADPALVQDFRRRYNEAVRGCPYNHARVDYLAALAESKGSLEAKAWAHLRYALDVYGLYGTFLLAPPLVLLLFR